MTYPRKRIILICIIAAVLILLPSIILHLYDKNMHKRSISFSYTIEIYTNNSGSYCLYLPLPINNDGTISDITKYLSVISGSATYGRITTTHGEALTLNSTKACRLTSTGNEFLDIQIDKHGDPLVFLSMMVDKSGTGNLKDNVGKVQNWAWMGETNATLYVKIILQIDYFSNDRGTSKLQYRLDGKMMANWQLLNGTYVYGVS